MTDNSVPYITYVSLGPSAKQHAETQRLAAGDGSNMAGSGTISDYERWIRDIRFGDYMLTVHHAGAALAFLTVTIVGHPSSLHPDSPYTPGTPINVNTQYQIPLGLDYLGFVDMAYYCAQLRGEHETAEHFLVRGQLYRDPHDPSFVSRVSDRRLGA